MAKPPRLLTSALTRTTYIVTSYDELPGGGVKAKKKHPLPERDLLEAVAALDISPAALDEVAIALGFARIPTPREASDE